MIHSDDIEIAKRSYFIWESEGRPDGKALDHWLRAKAGLEAEAAPSKPPKRARAAGPRKPRATAKPKTAKTEKTLPAV